MPSHPGTVRSSCDVDIEAGSGGVVVEVRRRGPCDAIATHDPYSGITTLCLVSKVAGPLGGDRQVWSVSVRSGFVVITEPNAPVVRRSRGVAIVRNRIEVSCGATCLWLPEPVLVGPGASFRLLTTARVAPGGALLLVDGFGLRAGARAGGWGSVSLLARTEVSSDRRLIWWDTLRVRRGARHGAGHFVQAVWVTDHDVDPASIQARATVSGVAVGASKIEPDAGVVRCLVDSSVDAALVQRCLARAWLEVHGRDIRQDSVANGVGEICA